MRKYIEICKIVNTHGVRGVLKAQPWCDSAKVLAGFRTLYVNSENNFSPLTVTHASVQKNMVLLTIEGYDSIEKAIGLKNRILYAMRDDIPLEKGAFLIDDLKGLNVIDFVSGKVYGTLNDVIQGAASDIYEIISDKGTVSLIPAVDEFVKKIDTESGIYICPIEGMINED